jgi:hypothetical protein
MNHTVMVSEEIDLVDERRAWPVWWSAVWVGALAALATALVIGLVGAAVGAHQMTPRRPIATWSDFGLLALVFSVFGAFLSFVVGGWAAARVAGLRRAETAMLHGALVWLLAVPLLLAFGSLGAAGYFGDWSLAGTPPWAGVPPVADAKALRNGALGALTAMLLGLAGGVVGGWLGSGEPMTLTHRRVGARAMAR